MSLPGVWSAPSAVAVGTGFVECRRLTFHKPSKDGSGKCDAQATENEGDRVHGVVFKININDKPSLDRAEGLGHGYEEETLQVVMNDSTISAIAYIATKRDRALSPYRWYKALTVAGAVEHGLPTSYVEWLRAIESVEDLDPIRRAENEAMLFAS